MCRNRYILPSHDVICPDHLNQVALSTEASTRLYSLNAPSKPAIGWFVHVEVFSEAAQVSVVRRSRVLFFHQLKVILSHKHHELSRSCFIFTHCHTVSFSNWLVLRYLQLCQCHASAGRVWVESEVCRTSKLRCRSDTVSRVPVQFSHLGLAQSRSSCATRLPTVLL